MYQRRSSNSGYWLQPGLRWLPAHLLLLRSAHTMESMHADTYLQGNGSCMAWLAGHPRLHATDVNYATDVLLFNES